MPLIPKKTTLDRIKETQLNCKACDEESTYNPHPAVCDICSHWICRDCTDISTELYQEIEKSKTKVNFFCNDCEEELPKVREMIKLNQRQQEIVADINKMKSDIAENNTAITAQQETNEKLFTRLKAVETVIKQQKTL